MTDVFTHPWLKGLFADEAVATLWSARAQLRHMLAFEAAWSRNGHLAGLWTQEAGADACKAIECISIDMAVLAEGTGRDGLCVPALVKLLKADAGEAVHTGATSQDLIDTATSLSIRDTCALLQKRLQDLHAALDRLAAEFGHVGIMGHTRMQAALPITAAQRIASWRDPLGTYSRRLDGMDCPIQIGGPVGDRRALGEAAGAFTAAMAQDLGLTPCSGSWHTARGAIAEFGTVLSLITGALGKMGQDIALMAQTGDIAVSGGGGSSAMPHKQNPVLAELLVTLARYNAVQVSGLHHALVHEQERSGSAWALEWMLLPQMAQATGRATNAAIHLCSNITRFGSD